MGPGFPDAGLSDMKNLIEPRLLGADGLQGFDAPEIRLHVDAPAPMGA